MTSTEKRTERAGSGSRALAYVFGFVALMAIVQIAVSVPRWDDGRAKVQMLLAVLMLIMSAVGVVRTWGRRADTVGDT